jgi:hypothetical protein
MGELRFPQPGEWWGNKQGRRFYCAGFHQDTTEHVVLRDQDTQYKVVKFSGSLIDAGWEPIPWCKSFDCVDPYSAQSKTLPEIFGTWPTCEKHEPKIQINSPQDQVSDLVDELEHKMVDNAESVLKKLEADVAAGESFPQYWTVLHSGGAFVKRMSKDSYVLVRKDGTESSVRPWDTDANYRRLLTEAEAMALLDKPVAADPIPAAPIKEPVSYVVQNRATVSEWRDQVRWSTWPAGHWEKATERFMDMMHGCKRGNAVLSVRCKEAELPDLTPMMLHREVKPFEELPSVSDATACVNLRVPLSGDEVTDNLIRDAVRRDIAIAFVTGSLSFSPGVIGRSDWQDSNQLADLPAAAVTFADELMKKLGFAE